MRRIPAKPQQHLQLHGKHDDQRSKRQDKADHLRRIVAGIEKPVTDGECVMRGMKEQRDHEREEIFLRSGPPACYPDISCETQVLRHDDPEYHMHPDEQEPYDTGKHRPRPIEELLQKREAEADRRTDQDILIDISDF